MLNKALKTYACRLIRRKPILVVAGLLVVLLAACSVPQPDGSSRPTSSPTATSTFTPEPPDSTPAPGDEGESDLILPSPTIAPTITPSVIGELVGAYIEAQGLQAKTFLGIRVDAWLDVGISLLLILLIGVLLARLLYAGLRKAVAKTHNPYALAFLKQIRTQLLAVVMVLGLQAATVRLSILDAIAKRWLNQLYILLYVVIATVILWRLLDTLMAWYQAEVEPKKDRQQIDTILLLLHRAARLLLITISGIMLLSLYNINVNALIAALGVGGLAISLAAQDTLSNVISGIMIMLDQPFRVGDRIEISRLGTWGDVVDIGLRSTRIRTRDNRLVIVPNNNISTDQIVNYTYPDPRYRIEIELGIGYGQDTEQVRQILVDTVQHVEGVLSEKPVDALYVNMGDSAMIFRVRWWIHSYVDTRRMFDRVNTALQTALDEAGIKTPYQTLDINILK